MILLVFTIIFTMPVIALIGFDCGGQHLNVTAISLLDVGECDFDYNEPIKTDTYIQLLQLSDYNYAEVIQCKVEIHRTITHCGMHSHASTVYNGLANYLHEVDHNQCSRMIRERTITIGNTPIVGLIGNHTTYRPLTLAGKITNGGVCKGTQYNDMYGTWDDVVVQGVAHITIKSSYVPVKLNSGEIRLNSGTICKLADAFCLDSEDGYTFWKPMPMESCNLNQYDVLYEGPATKITSDGDNSVVYSLTTQDVTFALTKTREQPFCGYTLLRTEHPKLFILETKPGNTFLNRGTIPINNLDIFTYMNSKFVYVEKHVRQQMTSLYHNVMQQKCKLEIQVITNALSFATLQPDEFAYRLMKGPGYMAVITGEAVQVIKCIPVEVTVRKTDECYAELPVTVGNHSYFLTPKSRIITKIGNEKECNFELPTLYRIENNWVQFTPHPQRRQLPQQLKPSAKLTWEYLTPGPLAVSGIYSEKDIEKLRDHIMFPAEKPALLNAVVRGLTGHTSHSDAVSIYNLLDKDSLNKIVESTVSRVWNGFLNFGSATAGILGIFLIIRIIKLVIDTAIHGYALHTVNGWSIKLFGALWSSLTHLLLHLARGPIDKPKRKDDDEPSAPSLQQSTTIRNDRTVQSQPLASVKESIFEPPAVNVNITPSDNQLYAELRDQMYKIEQIPPKTSEFV